MELLLRHLEETAEPLEETAALGMEVLVTPMEETGSALLAAAVLVDTLLVLSSMVETAVVEITTEAVMVAEVEKDIPMIMTNQAVACLVVATAVPPEKKVQTAALDMVSS